ncbi:MAG TPA: tetratricopeptide repeat protein [Ktedonobacteraceae bacterium]|nr:tetratricopeptide repeat protein [Ktedonobacteraceae bacterium]
MARQTTQTPNDNHDDPNDNPGTIFIGRERQIDDFKTFLARWQERMAQMGPDDMPEPAVPTPNNKIQGLVVMLFGRGGFGKSTLLRRYRNIVLDTNEQGSGIHVGGIVDWEFAIEGKRGLFNPPKGQAVDPVEYCKAIANELAPKLEKKFSDCKHLQNALNDVGNAQKEAHRTLETMQQDDRYGWLRGLAIEGVTTLIRAHVPASVPVLDDPMVKNATDEAAKLTQEQLTHLLARLRDRLNKDMLSDYLDPARRLGLAFGSDLRDWARNYPLLIFFDTYEEIDEGDALLRIVMGTAGPRVGWALAGRDNLWGGVSQIERNVAMEYGYKDLVPSDRGLSINFDASDVGAFSPADIIVYFALLQEKIPEAASLPPLTDNDAKRIWNVTQGVPLAVNIAAAIYRETGKFEAVTEKVEGKKTIIDQMVRRYLLHTRSNLNERHKLYGLAMLRRADQPSAIAAALGLTEEEAETNYRSELNHLHRRYSFIFTEKDIPALHQEVRYFLRLWLLERRTEPEIVAVNKRLLAAQETAFRALEEQREYATLKERLQDDEWVDTYLDLTEQQFWSDPVEGVKYILPFMIAAAIYKRDANKDAAEVGEFFEAHISLPYRNWWQWANQGLDARLSLFISPDEKIKKLELLEHLMQQRCPNFPSPLPNYQDELKGAIWWRLGEAYPMKGDEKALEWYEKALTVLELEQEIELREAAARRYSSVAYNLIKEEKYAEMIELLTRAIVLKSDFALAYNNRGLAYKNLKEYTQALADYTQAIALDPKYAFVYGNRGNAYNNLKKYEEAIADYTQAITLDPNDAKAYNNRGLAYYNLKEYTQALADYTQALTLDPNLATAYNNRGYAYLLLHKLTQASMNYDHAYKLDPKDINAAWMSLWADMSKQRPEIEVATQLESIAEINVEHYVAFVCRGLALGLRGELLKGLSELEKAIPIEPEEWDAYFWKGMLCAYYYRGRHQMVAEAIEKALEVELPPILLTPLYWLETDRPEFFEQYARPLLERYGM